MLDAVDGASAVAGNRAIADAMRGMRRGVEEGESLARLMAEHPFVPPMLAGLMEIGEETGRLPAMLEEAAGAIVICGDLALEDAESFIIQDCSAATQNILLAAHALGLGAVWIAIHPIPDRFNPCREILNVPENIFPFALIAAGHPNENLQGEDRLDPSRIHNNLW